MPAPHKTFRIAKAVDLKKKNPPPPTQLKGSEPSRIKINIITLLWK
jgi:hypothetical protein